MLSALYRALTALGAPAVALYLLRRRMRGREDKARFGERFGRASAARPAGRLVWFHGASVGEAVSVLLLIEKLHDVHPDISVLLTTGTVNAAKVAGARLPPYAIHQYAPVDVPGWVERFLRHWKPELAVWVESELWPNTLAALRAREVPAILLNARLSDKSFRNWRRAKKWAREILSAFVLCLAQTEDDRGRLVALGAKPVKCIGNLKYAAQPLGCDEAELAHLRGMIGARPVWLMASTHRGEEETAFAAQRSLAERYPDLLTVVAPRHAARGDEIAAQAKNAGLRCARRSKGDAIAAETQIYLADTMGEMGLFYRLCGTVVMGGSFAHVGGHNPIEPALLGAAIIFGPHMFNFTEIAREFLHADAAVQVHHGNEAAFAVGRMLAHADDRARYGQAARMIAEGKRHILDQVVAEMEPWLRA